MKNMKTMLKGALALAMVALVGTNAWAKTWYAKMEVYADTMGKPSPFLSKAEASAAEDKSGGVWVTKNEDSSPNYYAASDDSSDDKYNWSSSATISFWLYCKNYENKAEFLGWYNAPYGSSGTLQSTQMTKLEVSIKTSQSSSSSPETKKYYAYFHVHTMVYEKDSSNGYKINYKCNNTDTTCSKGGAAFASVTLNAPNVTYNGNEYAPTITGGDGTETLTYYNADGSAFTGTPKNAGTYKVALTWHDVTTDVATFSITAAPIDALSLAETDYFYTGSEQTVQLNTITASSGTLTSLTAGTDYTITGNKGTGDATKDTTYTVKVVGQGNYQGTQTIDWTIKGHTHNFACTVTEGKLTVVCNGTTTCTIPGGTSLEIVCENAGKVYDGTPLTATIKDNTPEQSSSAYTFETYTGGSYTEITWDDATANAGSHTATFTATVAGQQYQVSKTFTIEKKSIEGATMTLSSTSLPYSGADQTVTITSVKIGDFDVTYTEDADSVHTAKAIGTHTVKITANGNFTGTAAANWTITNYSGALKSLTAAETGVGTISGTTLTVTDSSKLEYDSANQVWYAGLVLTWDHSTVSYKDNDYDYGYAVFTKPAAAQFTIGDATYTGSDAVTGVTADGWNLSGAQKTEEYEYASVFYGGSKNYTYLDTTTLKLKLTPDIIEAAKSAGVITLSMYAGSLPFKEGDNNTQWSNGIKFDTYTITVPIDENLKLYDQYGNQVYPDAGYVAQVGNYKYTTLAAALNVATAELPVTLIGNAEAGTFEIGQNVTVNLAGFGNAEAAYKFVNVTDEAMSAKVVSTKQENVTTEVTGFGVQNDNYTYTLYRAHQHLWEAATSGATLTATCTNMTTDCDIDGRTTSITLTVTDNGDGNAPTFTIDNKDDFLSKVNKFGEVAVIGSVTAVRSTDDGAETTKWYIGNYTASCIVMVNGEEKTITQDFQIGGEYKAGGYVVASRNIRYGSFAEALAAATDGDTVYYRGGDVSSEDEQTLAFANVNKDITLDFGGKTFWYRGNADAYVTMSGTGTLTLQNIVLQQPRDKPSWGSYSYNDIVFSGGSFILGNGVNGASTDDKKLALKAVNASVEVQAGLYKCSLWAGDNGSVTIKGGEYWSNFNPASYVANGYVTVAATTSDYTYKVVLHTHNFYYVTEGNVITLRCQGAGYEGCDWTLNDNYLTLTAEDAFEGATYAGAKYVITGDSFLYDAEPVIEYYKDGVKEDVTPSTYGSYEARVTVTINEHGATATAVKAFTIKHVHQFKYDIAPAATLTATCTNAVSTCDIEGRSTAITLTVTPNGDGNAPTFAIANKDAFLAFVNRDATVATIGEITTVRNTDDGAAVTKWYVGDYTSTCIVTISGVAYTLTANFSIAKPEGGYTSGWTVGSRDIRYDSWEEAQAIFVDGDTIYYRDGNRDYTEHKFSIGAKNLTLDFCGATLKQASSISDMTIKNDGTGTLILQNVTIQQPKYLGISYQVSTEGNIVFGEGVKATNQADNKDRYLTITVNSGTLIVSNGLYQCGFATKSETETVNLRAGKYWENDKPAIGQYSLADRVCIEIEGDYKYEIVPHVHSFIYSAEGNVITSVCDGEYKEGCYWYQNPQTATLTANDAAESTEPYAGASVAYSDLWAGSKELAITYWQGESQLEGAPTRFGSYTAKITVGGATAEKSFTITPMAVTITVPSGTHAKLVKVLDGETEVTSETSSYTVTHGNRITATYEADEGYEPATQDAVLDCAEPGDTMTAPTFTPIAYAITYELNGGENDPANPATYTIEDAVMLKGATKRGYTSSWSPTNGIEKGSTGAKTFTANWTPTVYKVEYVMSNGTNHAENPTTYTVESDAITLKNPTRKGYEFTGWSPTNGIAAGSIDDRTFYATWTATVYKVEFRDAVTEETKAEPMYYTIETASPLALRELPTQDKYESKGWLTNRLDVAGLAKTSELAISEDMLGDKTFYVHFVFQTPEDPSEPDAPQVVIPQTVLTNIVKDAESKTADEISAELTTPDANGITKTERYVLQLDMDDVSDVPVLHPVQTTSTTSVRVNVGNIEPLPANVANAEVRYSIETSATPEFEESTTGEQQESPQFDLPLPASGVKYYRVKIDLVKPE